MKKRRTFMVTTFLRFSQASGITSPSQKYWEPKFDLLSRVPREVVLKWSIAQITSEKPWCFDLRHGWVFLAIVWEFLKILLSFYWSHLCNDYNLLSIYNDILIFPPFLDKVLKFTLQTHWHVLCINYSYQILVHVTKLHVLLMLCQLIYTCFCFLFEN